MSTFVTKHAATRQQQRGIPQLLLDLLMDFGSRAPAGRGASMLFFDKRAKKRLSSYAGSVADAFKEHLNVYAIVENETVITTGHRYVRIQKR